MKKQIFRFLKHAGLTILTLLTVIVAIGLSEGASANYGNKTGILNWHNDGPYIFYQDSLLRVNYVQGDKEEGFTVSTTVYSESETPSVTCFNSIDSTSFDFQLNTSFLMPAATYRDREPIFAVSDIEGNYVTFRNFLITNDIIDEKLKWSFGKGHLVLVGDFMDRGFFVTQVLWLIYKLEQEAEMVGGKVHFIIGNHELKNLQANFESASPKYYFVSSILGKQQQELYDHNTFIGRWLSTKNSIELINDHLFVHGGLHPDIQNHTITLEEINDLLRSNYRKPYFPKPNPGLEKLLTSSHTGLSWYRGYFKDDNLTKAQVAAGLDQFGAKAVVVGHTLQHHVKSQFDGLVIGIDVKHPVDDHKRWPVGSSEGLLIENGFYYRVFQNGDRKML